MRLITEDKNAQLDDLLNRICESLQLNKTRRESVEARYNAVTAWIEENTGSFNEAKMYAQGSYRIGTTVKPRNKEEYDLDFVVQTNSNWKEIKFSNFLRELFNHLNKNSNYNNILQEKSRCVRVDYADEFHMDIIPTCKQSSYGKQNEIMVPDKAERDWVESNPEGYALWFESKYIDTKEIYLERFYSTLSMEKAEDLPEEVPYELKQPLQRAVQLIKRYRDVYFEDNSEMAPSSIVLTTICGHFYEGTQSIYNTMDSIIKKLQYRFQNEWIGKRIVILNPVKPEEDFTKEWNEKPELQESFIEFVNDLGHFWQEISESIMTNLPDKLKSKFGESSVDKAFNAQANYILNARKRNITGISTATGMAVSRQNNNVQKDKPNTFYGRS